MPATEPAGAVPAHAGGGLARGSTSGLPASRAGGLADRAVGRIERIGLATMSGAALTFLLLPVAIILPMSFSSAASLRFPPPGLSLRWYREFFMDEAWLAAATNSLIVAGPILVGLIARRGVHQLAFPQLVRMVTGLRVSDADFQQRQTRFLRRLGAYLRPGGAATKEKHR